MYAADLHIHSKYSRATSAECVPAMLDFWARRKGIALLGSGDFTHPAWRQMLNEQLVPAQEGLYRLRDDLRASDPAGPRESAEPRFVISGEISSIYKQGGKVRKVHSLILLPSLAAAERLSARLEAIGNIHSDGRPILGLSAHDLLEITLGACAEAMFIPAHIWTPHFALFGAMSGFDSMEECFSDLTGHIHALETGLSSDPPMNWRWSALDRYTLVSNSDAHSPARLGREMNLIEGEMSYPALKRAIELGREGGFQGTVEFFPEEGKYHFDGHRGCHVCLNPTDAEKMNNLCPVCGKRMTMGVSHRVEQLADRPEGCQRPAGAADYLPLVPLPEVIGSCLGMSAAGVKVQARYEAMLHALGPELYILKDVPTGDIERAAGAAIAEGIRRMRSGQAQLRPGYDGEYGHVELLTADEIAARSGQMTFLDGVPSAPKKEKRAAASMKQRAQAAPEASAAPSLAAPEATAGLNERQREAVLAAERAVAVIAGPGTGKTKTLVARIAQLIAEGVKPDRIAAVTFTNKAAAELKERLQKHFGTPRAIRGMWVGTFHSICLALLRRGNPGLTVLDEAGAMSVAGDIVNGLALNITPKKLLQQIALRRQRELEALAQGIRTTAPGAGSSADKASAALAADEAGAALSAEAPGASASPCLEEEAYRCWCERLKALGVLDFDGLLLAALADEQEIPFRHLLVDEYQDVSESQRLLARKWSAGERSLFVIGDPDQSIYGFRGSDARCFERLQAEYADVRRITLNINYRCTPEILSCALPLIAHNPGEHVLQAGQPSGAAVRRIPVADEMQEGIALAREIGRMVGGLDMLEAGQQRGLGFGDVAVLYRTHRQAETLEKCLATEGIPYVVSGREEYLDAPEVQRAIAFLRLMNRPDDRAALTILMQEPVKLPDTLPDALPALCECLDGLGAEAARWAGVLRECAGIEVYSEEMEQSMQQAEQVKAYMEAHSAPPPGMSEVEARMLMGMAQLVRDSGKRKKEGPRRLLERYAGEIGVAKGDASFEKFKSAAGMYHELPAFLEALALGEEGDISRCSGKKYTPEAVRLMTLHGAKGLEFPVVFIAGLRKNVLPLETAWGAPADIEEERRLLYVGMTRAQQELTLFTGPADSLFLREIPVETLETAEAAWQRREEPGRQMSFL